MNEAIATLFLAHLIADYPLQTDFLVKAKRTWPGLTFHAFVHLLTVLIVCLPATPRLLPYLLTLAVVHFGIDAFKNFLGRRRPDWLAGPYLFDQFLHIVSIVAIAAWAVNTLPGGWPIDRPWQIYVIGFLLVTKVWYITERVLTHDNAEYQDELYQHQWSRMATRTVLLALFLALGHLFSAPGTLAASIALLPYANRAYRRRALFTDVAVALVVAFLVLITA